VKRTFKFLMRPTVKQAAALTMMLEDHRELYNAALAERRDASRWPASLSATAASRRG
jgi:putative transposase